VSGVLNVLLAIAPSGVVNLTGGGGASDTVAAPGTAQATCQFESDGDIVSITTTSGTVDVGDWVTPRAVAPGAYEILAHVNSGTSPTGSALDTWLALTSNRSWTLTQVGAGSKTVNMTISIRIGGVTLSSGTFVITVTVI